MPEPLFYSFYFILNSYVLKKITRKPIEEPIYESNKY